MYMEILQNKVCSFGTFDIVNFIRIHRLSICRKCRQSENGDNWIKHSWSIVLRQLLRFNCILHVSVNLPLSVRCGCVELYYIEKLFILNSKSHLWSSQRFGNYDKSELNFSSFVSMFQCRILYPNVLSNYISF